MEGDLDRIALPNLVSSSRRHELWRRSCFEIFLAAEGDCGYWEGNFCPSGDWNIYRFTDYRQGMTEEERVARPSCRTTKLPRRLEVVVDLDLRCLCPDFAPLAAGMACVVLETDGRVSYWALDHGREKPDFHDRRCFSLSLPEISARPPRLY
jgi:hypothetical protein